MNALDFSADSLRLFSGVPTIAAPMRCAAECRAPAFSWLHGMAWDGMAGDANGVLMQWRFPSMALEQSISAVGALRCRGALVAPWHGTARHGTAVYTAERPILLREYWWNFSSGREGRAAVGSRQVTTPRLPPPSRTLVDPPPTSPVP